MITNLSNVAFFKKKQILANPLFLLFLFIFGINQTSYAQVSAYTVQQIAGSTYTFLNANPSTRTYISPLTGIDDAVYPLALPFNFAFNGVLYPAGTNINVSTNGFITFGSTAPVPASYTPISSTTAYNGAISIYGANLIIPSSPSPNNNGLSYTVTGAVGSRTLIIEWTCRRVTSPADTNGFGFQLSLFEGTNVVEMRYRATPTIGNQLVLGEIGLRGAANADFNNFNFNPSPAANWPAVLPSGTANNNTVATRNTIRINTTTLIRFTPPTCFSPTAVTIPPASITSSAATFNWNLPTLGTPANYQWEIRTSGAAGSGPTGLAQSGTTLNGSVASLNASSLAAGVTYTFYIRTDCGASDFSRWTSGNTFTTLCNPQNVPYYQPFNNGVTTNTVAPNHGVLPSCTSQQNIGLGNNWVTTYSDTYYPEAAMDEYVLMYNGLSPGNANAANVWFFTEGINMVAGTTYRLSYYYAGTLLSTIENKMEVAYFSAPINTSLVATLDNHTSIKGNYPENIINFTPTTSGVYYIGFRAYSNASQGQLFLDDISIAISSCKKPTSVTVSDIGSSTAVLSWTPAIPAPSNGYVYFFNTTGVPPTNLSIPNGTVAAGVNNVTLTGLTGSTNYFFWVRSSCGFGEFGEWEALNNAGSPFFTTLVAPPTYCTPFAISIDGQGIINVTFGTVNNSSGDSGAAAGHYEDYSSLFSNTPQGETIPIAITYNTGIFDYNTRIWIDWNNNGVFGPFDANNDGDFLDAGDDASNELVFSGLSALTSPNTLNGSFTVPIGASLGFHRMRIGGADFPGQINGTTTNQGPCYNGFPFGTFEDYSVNVVVPPPPIGINVITSTQCAGEVSPLIQLTTPVGNFDTYSWSPSTGVTGNATTGWTITSNSTINYILTGTQTTAPFSTNTVKFNYIANQPPTPITITATAGSTICASGAALPLNTSGGEISGFTILSENFNTGALGWTFTNTSTGGNTAAPAWSTRADGFNRPPLFHSNDNSTFMISDSDSQGAGTTTAVTMVSPAFSLAGFLSANLSFWHHYRNWVPSTAAVEVSTNGTTWTTLQTFTTVRQGDENMFVNVNINLTPFVGQTNVQIRFRYNAGFGWYWAIDNFLVTGSATSAIIWSPTAGLFTNAAATIPYTGTGAATVFAKPTTTTTYTATASTFAPVCTATATQEITVVAVNAGTASSDQIVCNGLASDLTLTGFTGTVTQWQSANDAAFTSGLTNIPASASATLTAAQMGVITADKYFRAQVSNGSCNGFSNVVHIGLLSTTWNGVTWSNGLPDATKTVIFDADYTSSGDVEACSVVITDGAVLFLSGDNLVIQNTLNTTGGTLTFENNASLIQVNDVANTPGSTNGGNIGGITYHRDTTPVRKKDYTYWSSPVSPQTLIRLSPFTPSNLFFRFEPAITNNWISVPPSSTMDVGKGYIIRAPNVAPFSNSSLNVFHAYFDGSGSGNGVPNNGIITAPIAVGLGDANLIGNPYPSALSADAFLSYLPNTTVVDGTILLWTHNTALTTNSYVFDDYAMYNFSGGIGTGTAAVSSGVNNGIPTGNIASGQGFFIKGLSNGNVTFTNSMRVVGNNNQFFRLSNSATGSTSTTNLEKNRVWLEFYNDQGAFKQTMVGYITNATNNIDRGYDGQILEAGNVISFYSYIDNNKLGIQGRALPFDTNDIVPLGFKTTIAGNYKIKLSNFDGFFDTTNVYLEDLFLNVVHNLKQSDYNFVTEAGTFDGRFQLRYTDSSLANDEFNFNEKSVIVYKNNSDIIVHSSNTNMSNIKVFDIRGRQLFDSKKLNTNQFVISNLNSSQQVVLVTITSVDGVELTKKIIF